MQALITVGLGFGDEGKGATVDDLARRWGADLVVRYSGGAQAGHNVELSDGRRHTFSQFGSGTLAGVGLKTYLGPAVIISPSAMVAEAEHLRSLSVADPFGLLSAHPECLVSTSYHVCMNRLRESARGDLRHGSCGLGIGETRHYWLRHGQDAVFAADLKDPRTLQAKLSLMRGRFLLEMQDLPRIDETLAATLHESWPASEAEWLQGAAGQLALSNRLPDFQKAIFEGAQGVLLDEWKGFHPHTTWSTVTPLHALEMLHAKGVTDVTVLGVTRAYTTRHGAGPFPTWCPRMSAEINDIGNPTNSWQDSIRCGPLDLLLLDYAARVCDVDGLVVNCLDQLPARPRICTRYGDCTRLQIPRTLQQQSELTRLLERAAPLIEDADEERTLEALSGIAPVVSTSYGPCSSDRNQLLPVMPPVPTAPSGEFQRRASWPKTCAVGCGINA